MRRILLAGAALAFLSGAVEGAAEEPVPPPVTTHHVVTVAGRPIRYAATFTEKVLHDAAGRPQATISATSYVRTDVPRQTSRPVIFAFNGGPGASSSPLQFEGFGPRLRLKAADGRQSIADNPDSLIGGADLVFIDPVGTGLSRVLPGGSGKPYWSVPGDAKAVLGMMRAWLRTHRRERSPVIVAGESYGGARAARICADAGDLNLVGLILISPSFDSSPEKATAAQRDAAAVALLPTMAVAAAQNGRGESGRPQAEVFEEARRFAIGEYSAALAAGDRLSSARRRVVADRVASFLGMSPETVLAAGLRVDPEDFRKELRAADHLVVGLLDTRVTAPVPRNQPGRPSQANDPALGLGASNVILSDGITRYMHGELAVPGRRPYVSLTLDVNFQWDWSASVADPASRDLAGNIARTMRAKPRLKTMLIGGFYDMAVPVLGPRRQLEQAGAPMQRVHSAMLWTGHSVFDSAAERKTMSRLFAPLLNRPD
ncbi:S10 family serine carboxypeptidase-like protein [Sphingomonas carotinifaciens]|uniref:Carboxypeptidase C (Cathepsin A) n=1 Tax=Sphingomonas carotinifaciens TaxID=1166323 RepID=A0A1G7Q0C8_9SPHN|nr:alpha/beta hydrolase [Sphingomonas carotinifaciens]MBB4087581.1 carboxypeptidase C (cathepsin A) [Sphingomonas carotinifaciens]MWC45665.1 hypothetical protein [Sphingomonas carotinifaciens]SDF91918.1 Carboxypeptidase C (cathepsin A) [Sphingomonas carotinifaciens]